MMLSPSPLFCDAFSVTPAPLIRKSPAPRVAPPSTWGGGGAPAPVRGDAGAKTQRLYAAMLTLPYDRMFIRLLDKKVTS